MTAHAEKNKVYAHDEPGAAPVKPGLAVTIVAVILVAFLFVVLMAVFL